MSRSVSLGLLLIRVAFGLTCAAHGMMKVLDFAAFSPKAGGVALALGAIAGELLGGLGIAVGLLTRVAGAGLSAVMLTIAFTHHAALLAKVGTGPGTAFEYPFLLGVFGLAMTLTGAGPLSLDARLGLKLR